MLASKKVLGSRMETSRQVGCAVFSTRTARLRTDRETNNDIDSCMLTRLQGFDARKLGIECSRTMTTKKKNCSVHRSPDVPDQPPRSPNSLAQSSNSFSPEAETLGRMLTRLALKSVTSIGLISSGDMWSSFSPSERRGPMAASFAKAVISLPEKPESYC